MDWLELTIKTASPGVEAVTARLTALGYDSFIIDDQKDFQSFIAENRAYWDYIDESLAQRMKGLSQIRLYLEDSPASVRQAQELAVSLRALREEFPDEDLGPLTVKAALCRNEDWENNWKAHYQPIAVGQRLLVVPEWLRPDNPEERIPLFLDPGMIFGTGSHASTRMCLEALEQAVRPGDTVLDLGGGSGILSIAALLLGASSALCVDIDPLAEDVARANAKLNGMRSDCFQARTGDILTDRALMESLSARRFDLVLANIVADVIIALAPAVPGLLGEGGRFICSGILEMREGEVLGALDRAGLRVTGSRCEEDWVQLTTVRKD